MRASAQACPAAEGKRLNLRTSLGDGEQLRLEDVEAKRLDDL